MLNSILIVVSLIAVVLILFSMYQKSKGQQEIIEEDDFGSIDKVVEAVKLEMVEIIKDDYSLGLTEAEAEEQPYNINIVKQIIMYILVGGVLVIPIILISYAILGNYFKKKGLVVKNDKGNKKSKRNRK